MATSTDVTTAVANTTSTEYKATEVANTTGTAVDLSTSSPVYTQIISTGTATETHSYKLNCGAAGSIPGNGERRFAMVVRAPADAGTGKLSWQVTPDGPSAGAAITIT